MENILPNETLMDEKGKVGDIVEFERRGLSILGKVSIAVSYTHLTLPTKSLV